MRGSSAKPNHERPVQGELLTVAEASKKTRHSREWFYRHMRAGTLPFPWFLTSPGKRFIDSADIENWMKLMQIPTASMPKGY